MTQKTKNILSIAVIVLMLIANVCTAWSYQTTKKTAGGMQMAGQSQSGEMKKPDASGSSDSETPPEKPSGSQDSASDQSSGSSDQSVPDKPSGEMNSQDGQTPPEMPTDVGSGSTSDPNASSDSQTPPEKPAGETGSSDSQTPPEMPSGDMTKPDSGSSSDSTQGNSGDTNAPSDMGEMPSDMGQAPDMGGEMPSDMGSSSMGAGYISLFAIENLILMAAVFYLIFTKGNKKNFREVFRHGDKILIFVLAVLLLGSGLTVLEIFGLKNVNLGSGGGSDPSMNQSSEGVDASGAVEITDTQSLSGDYDTTKDDENTILVKDGGKLSLTDSNVTKSGDSSNTEDSEFYGINAGILVQKDSSAEISNADITTSGSGANAVFATGENAKITIKDSTITTTSDRSSRGLDATYGGEIDADNVTITTAGGSCASVATDRGEGTVTVKNSKLTTTGSGSPVVYSTGAITLTNTIGNAESAQMVVIEGKNSATINQSTLTCSAAPNRQDVDKAGIMIYQSMSGDASEGTGNFAADGSSLSIDSGSSYYKSAPMFFITNTHATISLKDTKLNFGSGTLIKLAGTDEWGTSGSNGGSVEFTAENQTLEGNVLADNLSSAEFTLTKSSYTGTINAENTAKEINITLDKDSTLTLTGDSYITSLTNADSSHSNINLNGHKLYVNGTELS